MSLAVTHFSHHFLIAMPHLEDENFAYTITYIIRHDHDGAIGLIVNRPLTLAVKQLLEEMNMRPIAPLRNPDQPVLDGGPVNPQVGFVIHKDQGQWQQTVPVQDNFYITSSRDILDAIAKGKGPDDYQIALGYAGWEAGQLEQEIAENSWLTCPADEHLLFVEAYANRWQATLHKLGVDPAFLAQEAGHA